jgi:hypothetical protein
VTRDKNYFYVEFSVFPIDAPPRVRTTIASRKFMLAVIRGVMGFDVVDLMTTQKRFNSEYFVEHIIKPLVNESYPGRRNPHAPRIQVHLDNCPV